MYRRWLKTGLTLEQLAQKVTKTSRVNLSRIERGEINITVKRWLQICKALDIKITLD